MNEKSMRHTQVKGESICAKGFGIKDIFFAMGIGDGANLILVTKIYKFDS